MTTLMTPDQTHPAPPPGLIPFPLTMQLKMKRYYGHLFLAAGRMYFVCDKQGGAWAAAIGQGLGGAIGGAIVALGTPGAAGDVPPIVDELTVQQVMAQRPGSFVLEASQISMIKHTVFWRLIKWNGNTIGLPQGMSKALKLAIGPWAKYHGVPNKGFG
ncbi:MAG: hypothetical protein IPQ07_27670 [Myxococcales bacterium]|nr:hypothetical protein [Myxococcales bacterium]